MNLSMWMIADALKHYRCRLDITRGTAEIRGARFLSQVEFMQSDMVYIGARNEYFDGHATNGVICTFQNDSIIIDGETQLEIFNDLLNLIDRYQRWESLMEKAVEEETGLEALIRESAAIFPGRLWIVERGGRVCCSIGESKDETMFYSGERNPFLRSACMHLVGVYGEGNVRQQPFSIPPLKLCCQDLYDGNYRVGMILAEMGDMPERCLMQLLEILGGWVEKWMSFHPDREDLPWDGNMLRQLLNPKPESACIRDFMEYLQSIGWKTTDDLVLYIAQHARENRPHRGLKYLASTLPGTVVTSYEKYILILENNAVIPVEDGVRRMRELAQGEAWAVGMSYSFRELKELYQGYRQALLALESGCQPGEIRHCSNYLLPYVAELVHSQTCSDLSHPAIRILEAYDRENGTELVNTLAVYLLCERGQKQTAAALALHRNSVFYRLNQIQTLCGLNLEDPKTRLQLIMSFLLRGNGRYPGLSEEVWDQDKRNK